MPGNTFTRNLHAPGGGRATIHESPGGAFGIPECMPPIRRRTYKVNLHAPGGGRTTNHENPAGALGIPEFMPPIRRRFFKVKGRGKAAASHSSFSASGTDCPPGAVSAYTDTAPGDTWFAKNLFMETTGLEPATLYTSSKCSPS